MTYRDTGVFKEYTGKIFLVEWEGRCVVGEGDKDSGPLVTR